jgi:hypothetical protein
MVAQIFVGPAIIPGLMASGLILLAIGSIKIIGESLTRLEIIAVFLMIVSITLLGLSQIKIEIMEINLIEFFFILRMTLFTSSIF